MKKFLQVALCFILILLASCSPSYAITDPFSVPNNRIGVHILDPLEIDSAAKLVNSSGGDWGYVTVPIRVNDRDPEKWTKFFTSARQLHIIPIIRLATYPNSPPAGGWVRPTVYDLVDFANFLGDMPWPTKNRYIILFNEPNHDYEWGGSVDPISYATFLIEAKQIFKSRSADFFLLSAGLDMAVPTSRTSINALDFYRLMTKHRPTWYDSLDGLAVHAYPNPGFSAGPFTTNRYSIVSYRYETSLLSSYGFPPKPIFITETGTVKNDNFYTPAFTQVWTDPQIVAITPFLLYAASGDFAHFSLLDPVLQPKASYTAIRDLPKVSGSPLLANPSLLPALSLFSTPPKPQSPIFRLFLPPQTRLTLGETTITVELADTDFKRNQGLSGRTSLAPNSGMLFIFPQADRHTFWMKDMYFALDFIWIKDNSIVQLTENVLPPSQTRSKPVVITPDSPVDQVLEVNAGFIRENHLKVGDSVMLNFQ